MFPCDGRKYDLIATGFLGYVLPWGQIYLPSKLVEATLWLTQELWVFSTQNWNNAFIFSDCLSREELCQISFWGATAITNLSRRSKRNIDIQNSSQLGLYGSRVRLYFNCTELKPSQTSRLFAHQNQQKKSYGCNSIAFGLHGGAQSKETRVTVVYMEAAIVWGKVTTWSS